MRNHYHVAAPAQLNADRSAFLGLLILLAWLPWSRGAHTNFAQAVLGVAVSLLLVLWAVQVLRNRVAPPRLGGSAVTALALWALWLLWNTAFLLPLPQQHLAALSSGAAEVHAALAPVSNTTARNTLSIVPSESWRQLLLSLTYFGLYLLGLLTITSRKRLRLVLLTLVYVGAVQALYGIQRMVAGFELAGFAIPTQDTDRASGSFINPNHFAGYLELVLAAGLGLILADLQGWQGGNWRRWISEIIELSFSTKFRVRVLMIAVVVAMVLSRSRMGNAAFMTALCFCGVVYLLLRKSRWLLPALFLFTSVALVDVWIISDRFGLDRLVSRIQTTELSQEERPLVLADLQPVFDRFAHIGAGPGSFEAAYSPYRDETIRKRYDHAHNEYAEFLIETGAVGMLILALWVGQHGLHALRVIRNRRDPIRSGVAFTGFMALTCVLIHAAAEFLLRIPAITATLMVLMAMTINLSPASRSQLRPSSQMSSDTVGVDFRVDDQNGRTP